MLTIDAHQHFWDPDDGDYAWMTDAYAPIRRCFSPSHLQPELQAAGIAKTILVQTWSSQRETEQFLSLANDSDFIEGVVGWVDLTGPDVKDAIELLLNKPGGKRLVGIRHQVHDEPDENWLLRDDVQLALQAIGQAGLTYDLLIRPREFSAALKTVENHPQLRFVIDHIGKPDIKNGAISSWRKGMESFAQHRNHMWVKLSGMVTEAEWSAWTTDQIRPYIDTVVELFGPERCMIGSDWPVCLLAADYATTVGLVTDAIASLDHNARQSIRAGSAIAAYRLHGSI
jgi:L-fuconolactonase